MKNLFLLSVLLLCMLNTGCSDVKSPQTPTHAQNSSSAPPKNPEQSPAALPQITFIELGSVNCIPCKMMQPVMEKIESAYHGKVKVIFHDVWTDEGKPFGAQYKIRAIPTQIFLDKEGKEFFRHEGFYAFEEIQKLLKEHGVE